MLFKRKISRRNLLNNSLQLGVSFYLLPLGLSLSESANAGDEKSIPPKPNDLGFFSDRERTLLGVMADQVFPNAATLGAVRYIETLLTAFETDPPKIYAGGPYSGRTSFSENGKVTQTFPQNSFPQFMPLNRIQEAGWRLRLYGSRSLKTGYWNEKIAGPVVGLRDLIKQGIEDSTGKGYQLVDFNRTSNEFQKAVKALVVESCFCDPEYGGNQGLQGWKLSHFAGDMQPLGYSLYNESKQSYQEREDFPISTYDSTNDEPLGKVSRFLCSMIARFHNGRIYR